MDGLSVPHPHTALPLDIPTVAPAKESPLTATDTQNQKSTSKPSTRKGAKSKQDVPEKAARKKRRKVDVGDDEESGQSESESEHDDSSDDDESDHYDKRVDVDGAVGLNSVEYRAVTSTSTTTTRSQPRRTGISSAQQRLLNRVFQDDEDDSKFFYVAEVKYFADFDQVCCFCVPYTGNLDAAKALAECAKAANEYDDENIYDCVYVRGRIKAYEMTAGFI